MSRELPYLDPKLREIYDLLYNEVSVVTIKWQTALELFGHSRERVNLLNRTAVSFFQICQATFRDDAFMALSRLTDPVEIRKKENLCLHLLFARLDKDKHPEFAGRLAKLIDDAKNASKSLRYLRDKTIAHSDLATLLNRETDPLQTMTIGQINKALKSAQNVINAFAKYFLDTTILFDHISQHAGVRSLTRYLERGEQGFNEDRQQKLNILDLHAPDSG